MRAGERERRSAWRGKKGEIRERKETRMRGGKTVSSDKVVLSIVVVSSAVGRSQCRKVAIALSESCRSVCVGRSQDCRKITHKKKEERERLSSSTGITIEEPSDYL